MYGSLSRKSLTQCVIQYIRISFCLFHIVLFIFWQVVFFFWGGWGGVVSGVRCECSPWSFSGCPLAKVNDFRPPPSGCCEWFWSGVHRQLIRGPCRFTDVVWGTAVKRDVMIMSHTTLVFLSGGHSRSVFILAPDFDLVLVLIFWQKCNDENNEKK